MDASRVRARVRKHLEAQAWEELRAELRQFRRRMFPSAREIVLRPRPETEDGLDFIRAHREGGERSAWAAFERRTGVRSDSLAKQSLSPDLEHVEDLIVPQLGRHLDVHRRRLVDKAECERRSAEAQKLYASWYAHPELKRALDSYADPLVEVHRALLDAEKRIPEGETPTPGKVEYRVRHDNRASHISVESTHRKMSVEGDVESWNTAL